MQKLLLIIPTLVVSFSLLAQQDFCETKTDASYFGKFDELLRQHKPSIHQRSNTIIEVPVVFHIELENGNPVYSESTLLTKLALVNTYFLSGNVQFTNCQPILYYEDNNTERISNVINTYLYSGSSGCGVYTGASISINVSCNRTFEHILAHELGHALGLPHTHGYTNTGTTTELVDGSNCLTAGDRFCDTPADPNLLGLVNGSCIYTGNGTDANGEQYMPDVSNIMSYTRSTCADTFSLEQLNKMYSVAQALNYSCCRVNPPTASDTSVCYGESISLIATSDIPSAAIHWYDQSKGGSLLHIGEQYQTPPLYDSKAYYVEVVDSCISDRIQILVTVNPSGGLQLLGVERFDKLGPAPEGQQQAQGSYPQQFLPVGDSMVLFIANSKEIYRIKQGSDSAELVNDDFVANPDDYLSAMLVLEDQVIIAINNHTSGPSLWSMNMMSYQTLLLKQFGADYGYSNYWLTKVGSQVFAQLNHTYPNFVEYAELWKTDGTSVGTSMVKDLRPTNPFVNFSFTPFNDQLIFTAEDSLHGQELWITDGTTENTDMILDIYPGPTGSGIGAIHNVNGMIYFTADDSTHGQEIWTSNGTAAGTMLFKDINPGTDGSNAYYFTPLMGSLYFTADDGSSGYEPYFSDGTPEGTFMLEDLYEGSSGSSPGSFTLFQGDIYFSANGGGFNYELYRINQFQQVELVKDLHPTGSSSPSNLFVTNNLLLFTANNGQTGTELWQTDGSSTGTQLVYDIRPGNSSSYPSNLFSFDDRLFFTATDSCGNELWVLDDPELTTCFGGSITVRSQNATAVINWYDQEIGGSHLGSGQEITISDIQSNMMLYGQLDDQNCTGPRIPVLLEINENCPCTDLSAMTVSANFGSMDQFAIESSGTLKSISLFEDGSAMIFQAAQEQTFMPTFEIQHGAVFEAVIAPCDP